MNASLFFLNASFLRMGTLEKNHSMDSGNNHGFNQKFNEKIISSIYLNREM
jgi:hypothetical protein